VSAPSASKSPPSGVRGLPLPAPELSDRAHKGDAGRVLCLCGSRTMPGAAILVVRAASRAGAGLVTLACFDRELLQVVPSASPETIYLDLAQDPAGLPALLGARDDHARVAGPGLGATERTRAALEHLTAVSVPVPLVLDADALNVLGPRLEDLRRYRGPLVLTPHPGEAARLLGHEVPANDEARAACAMELSERSGGIAVLKGHRTVVAQGGQGSRLAVNTTGNAGMATAGSGDVLAGILGAYLALCASGRLPSWTPYDAVRSAVHVHGLAGDLAAAELGRRALIASDLIAFLPAAQRKLATCSREPC
jgi:ADP-dependent NAD(P)H-hydrate dehydratase / NAD(P)H-hydrate epimerase